MPSQGLKHPAFFFIEKHSTAEISTVLVSVSTSEKVFPSKNLANNDSISVQLRSKSMASDRATAFSSESTIEKKIHCFHHRELKLCQSYQSRTFAISSSSANDFLPLARSHGTCSDALVRFPLLLLFWRFSALQTATVCMHSKHCSLALVWSFCYWGWCPSFSSLVRSCQWVGVSHIFGSCRHGSVVLGG